MQHDPLVTIIMPVRNEARYIRQSLGAVLQQNYPHDRMEVLVVDGRSNDDTGRIIAEVNQQVADAGCLLQARILDNPAQIVPTAMNIGIQHAQGDIIVRVDGHLVIVADYVKECVTALQRSGAANVGGPICSIGHGYIGNAIALATSTPFGIGNSSFRYSNREQYVDTVPMGAFRRDVLMRAGLFDETMVRHQDYELNYRIRKQGGTILLSPTIRSHYYVRTSIRRLCKQYLQYGQWKAVLLRNHPDSLRWRHAVPPLFVLCYVVCILLTIFTPFGWWFLAALSGTYLCFLIGATAATSWGTNKRYAPLLPIIFTTLHISYGLGIWLGLFSKKPHERRSHSPIHYSS